MCGGELPGVPVSLNTKHWVACEGWEAYSRALQSRGKLPAACELEHCGRWRRVEERVDYRYKREVESGELALQAGSGKLGRVKPLAHCAEHPPSRLHQPRHDLGVFL